MLTGNLVALVIAVTRPRASMGARMPATSSIPIQSTPMAFSRLADLTVRASSATGLGLYTRAPITRAPALRATSTGTSRFRRSLSGSNILTTRMPSSTACSMKARTTSSGWCDCPSSVWPRTNICSGVLTMAARSARSRCQGSSFNARTCAAKVQPPQASRAWYPMSSRVCAMGSTCCSLSRPCTKLCCASRSTVSVIKTLGTPLLYARYLGGLLASVGFSSLDQLLARDGIVEREDAGREVGRVPRAGLPDGDRRHWDTGRHLGHREERVEPTQGAAGHRNADHWQQAPGRHHARKMCRPPCGGNEDLESTPLGLGRPLTATLGVPVRRADHDFIADAIAVEHLAA